MKATTTDTLNPFDKKDLAAPTDLLEEVASREQAAATPLKVLLSAYSCLPNLGSEPGVGWNNVIEISTRHEVWVLTIEEFREPIEAELALHPLPNVHWVFVDIPKILMTGWKKGERGRRIHYNLWQYWAYREGKRLHEQIHFDIVHHVTFVSYWTPSYLALLDTPFVWGPVGGGDSTPLPYYRTLSWKSRFMEFFRDSFRFASEAFDPYVRKTAQHAAISLATTEVTAGKMRKLGAQNVHIMSECALASEMLPDLEHDPTHFTQNPFRVISMGRLIGWKGYHLGIEAFVKLHQQIPDSEYWIIGTGAEENRLKALVAKLDAEDYIHFTGLLPREEALQQLVRSHVLLHPSLHDTGGWVLLEAMAAGLPIVCLNLGGPATIVNDETGFRASGANPKQSIIEIAAALETLANDRELCLHMGAIAKRKIYESFTWGQKGEMFDRIYTELVPTR